MPMSFSAMTLFFTWSGILKTSKIGLVDTNMVNRGMKEEGISYQEKAYISREVRIKDHESRLWGAMMGPFGGCYAIRKEDYAQVPANFLVDDFYINMSIFEKGKLAINDVHAIVFENLPDELKVEFRRKVRIGTGNFQNLRKFWRLIFTSRYGFAFLSHKVVRWFGPFFLLIALAANIYLAFGKEHLCLDIIMPLISLFYSPCRLDFEKAQYQYRAFPAGDTFFLYECRPVYRFFPFARKSPVRRLGTNRTGLNFMNTLFQISISISGESVVALIARKNPKWKKYYRRKPHSGRNCTSRL